MSSILAEMTPGFRDPVHGSQRTFRALLDAMSRPGTPVPMPPQAIDGIEAPSPVGRGVAAVLLALLDAETTVALVGAYDRHAVSAYLRFHVGARVVDPDEAMFTLARADEIDAALCARLACGSDEAPEDGATLVVALDAMQGDTGPDPTTLLLQGPGIAHETQLVVGGPARAFWHWRIALASMLPRGVDLILVREEEVVAIPRSSRVRILQGSD